MEQLQAFLLFISNLIPGVGHLFMVSAPYVAGFILIWGILIEFLEAIVAFTPSKKDDDFVSKIKTKWPSILKVLEVLPHSNLPAAPIFTSIFKAISKILKILKVIKE